MSKQKIITIAGKVGSGKSSSAKAVAKMLNYRHFSSGDLFREIASKQQMDLLAANHHAEKNSDADHQVDSRLREIGRTDTEVVIDSRTAWHWIPGSFKVYLTLDTLVAAQRIIDNIKHRGSSANEKIPTDVGEYAKLLDARYISENKRYMSLYQIDPAILTNYNLVIDTGKYDLTEVVDIIYRAYQEWLDKNEP